MCIRDRVSFAATDDVLNVELGSRDLSQEQIDKLLKDPEKLKIRAELDAKYLLDKAEQEMNNVVK